VGDIEETQTLVSTTYLGRPDKRFLTSTMIHPNNNTVRSVFIIDPNKKLRLTFTYPQHWAQL